MDQKLEPHFVLNGLHNEQSLRFGDDIIALEDFSQYTYTTKSLQSFVNYVVDRVPVRAEGSDIERIITFVINSVTCLDDQITRYSAPHAICELTPSNPLSIIKRLSSEKLSIAETERLLRSLVRYRDTRADQLYAYVRDFEMHKITTVKRMNDDRANFCYEVKRGDAASIDPKVELPRRIGFTVPLFDAQSIDLKYVCEFDVVFTWKEEEQNVRLSFSFENPELKSDIDKAMISAIQEAIAPIKMSKYEGGLGLIKQDDSWQYHKNALSQR